VASKFGVAPCAGNEFYVRLNLHEGRNDAGHATPFPAVRMLRRWFLSSSPFLSLVIFVSDSVLQTRKIFPQNILETVNETEVRRTGFCPV
jgi:hypothetical protein